MDGTIPAIRFIMVMTHTGRPSKLTPDLQLKICEYISQGNYISTACQACGINTETFRQWRIKGEAGEEPYNDFLKAVNIAEAECEAMLAQHVMEAAPKTWVAAMTMLERRWPERYGRMDRTALGDPERMAKGMELLSRLVELARPKEIEGKCTVVEEGEDEKERE